VGSVLPAVIVELTNDERTEAALGTLRRNTVLDEAARLKAQHMAKNEYFAHYSPDGVSPWHWFGEANYNFVHAGENLAIHFTDSTDVVEAWMESPTHRANIMNGNYAEIGVGTAEGTYEGFKTVYVVQLFGTPAAAATPVPTPIVAGESADVEEKVAVQPEAPDSEDTVLSGAVTLTETVEIKPAQPVVSETVEVVAVTEEASSTETVPVEDMEVTDAGVALYSDFIATSTGGIPATLDPSVDSSKTTPLYAEIATQPHRILQMLYMVIGTCVFISLMLSIFIEIRRQQPVQIVYGVGLLSLMFTLFYIHSVLSQGASIL
jgi:hypothetical protein